MLGLKGQGKTSLLRLIHRRLSRSIVVDDHEEFSEGVRIRAFPDLVAYLYDNCDKPFKVLYTSEKMPVDPFEDDSEFNRFCRFIFNVPDMVLFINEVGLYTDPGRIPEGLKVLIAQGRREYIDIIATVRRKAETHNMITSQQDILVSFKQTLPEDVKYMSRYIGSLADKIPTLETWHFAWTNGAEMGFDAMHLENGELVGAEKFLSAIDLNGGYSR